MDIKDPTDLNAKNASSKNQPPKPSGTTIISSSTTALRFGNPNQNPNTTFIGGGAHRRAHSEATYRLPDDYLMDPSPSVFNCGGSSANSFEDPGSEDDLFYTYIDVEKLGGNDSGDHGNDRNCTDQSGGGGGDGENGGGVRAKHRHNNSNSDDGSTSSIGDIMEAKKAMPPDKLAELWTIDPKRAKRILANRQSAARSKERKARYIIELERKVQTLQTEATTLSAQLTLFQRDTTDLSTENTELKLRLQAMEQQAQLRDALNEALKKEVERLRIATGEMMSPSESFDLGMRPMQYNASTFFSIPQQSIPSNHQHLQCPPTTYSQSNISNHHLHQTNSHPSSDIMQKDSIGRLQGLDISSKVSALVKSEGPSLSASESSRTF